MSVFLPSSYASAYGYGAASLATGYYADGGGYAWYYNAEGDYFDLVAAPGTKFKKRVRHKAGSDTYKAALLNANSRSAQTEAEVLAIAARGGGKALPNTDNLPLPAAEISAPAPASEPSAGAGEAGEAGAEKPGEVAPSGGRRTKDSPGGLSTAQMIGIGAGVALLIGAAFVIRANTK